MTADACGASEPRGEILSEARDLAGIGGSVCESNLSRFAGVSERSRREPASKS
jgi:hypothetical protein